MYKLLLYVYIISHGVLSAWKGYFGSDGYKKEPYICEMRRDLLVWSNSLNVNLQLHQLIIIEKG